MNMSDSRGNTPRFRRCTAVDALICQRRPCRAGTNQEHVDCELGHPYREILWHFKRALAPAEGNAGWRYPEALHLPRDFAAVDRDALDASEVAELGTPAYSATVHLNDQAERLAARHDLGLARIRIRAEVKSQAELRSTRLDFSRDGRFLGPTREQRASYLSEFGRRCLHQGQSSFVDCRDQRDGLSGVNGARRLTTLGAADRPIGTAAQAFDTEAQWQDVDPHEFLRPQRKRPCREERGGAGDDQAAHHEARSPDAPMRSHRARTIESLAARADGRAVPREAPRVSAARGASRSTLIRSAKDAETNQRKREESEDADD